MSSALNKKTVEDIEVSGKRVLVRCDFNVKMENGVIGFSLRALRAAASRRSRGNKRLYPGSLSCIFGIT